MFQLQVTNMLCRCKTQCILCFLVAKWFNALLNGSYVTEAIFVLWGSGIFVIWLPFLDKNGSCTYTSSLRIILRSLAQHDLSVRMCAKSSYDILTRNSAVHGSDLSIEFKKRFHGKNVVLHKYPWRFRVNPRRLCPTHCDLLISPIWALKRHGVSLTKNDWVPKFLTFSCLVVIRRHSSTQGWLGDQLNPQCLKKLCMHALQCLLLSYIMQAYVHQSFILEALYRKFTRGRLRWHILFFHRELGFYLQPTVTFSFSQSILMSPSGTSIPHSLMYMVWPNPQNSSTRVEH